MQIKDHKVGPNNLFVREAIPDTKSFDSPLVLVHGSFGGAEMWKMVAHGLSEMGFHAYALSLRGHMPNEKINLGEVGMSDYVEDIKQVIEALKLESPVVVGHSMAGLLVLMYTKDNPVKAAVLIDPSTSSEVQREPDEVKIAEIPDVYNVMQAGMPMDPMEVMKALPDVSQEVLMQMKDMLGEESGKARRDRKRGISVPEGSISAPLLIMGAELGDSLPFGISLESSRNMAEYYNADFFEVKGATHPGMLMGEHSGKVVAKLTSWLKGLEI